MLSTIKIYKAKTPHSYSNNGALTGVSDRSSSYGRILVNHILENGHTSNNESDNLSVNRYGKPIDLKNRCADFSISYTTSHTFVAISSSGQVGIDAEMIDLIDIPSYELFCTEDEAEYIEHSRNKTASFYEIWTLKEAYLKYLGVGLTQSLQSISFKIHADKTVTYTLASSDTFNLLFRLIRDGNIQIAVCYSPNDHLHNSDNIYTVGLPHNNIDKIE